MKRPPQPVSLGQLYEISRVLTGFEGLEKTVPALLAIAGKSLAISSLVIIEKKRGRPRLLLWHSPRQSEHSINAARAHALAEFSYLGGSSGPLVDPEIIDVPLDFSDPAPGADGAPGRYIVLPLAVNSGEIFGTLQMALAGPLDAQGLAFVNAITNLLSISLDRHYALLVQAAVMSEGPQDQAIFMLTPEGLVSSWNAGAERVNGYSADEIIGRPLSCLYAETDGRARLSRELEDSSRQGRCEQEDWLVRKDGSRFWAHSVTTALRDNNGKVVGFARATRDLTERRKIEEALRSSEQERQRHARDLERAVADLEAFSHTVSHNLRGPLRAMQGYAFYVRRNAGEKLDAESRGMLDRLSSATLRMDRLIRDLLAFSQVKRADLVMEPIDLDPLVAHLVEDYPEARRTAVRVKSPLVRVMGQESLVMQALSNLIENAVKFIPAGREPVVEICAEKRGDWVRVSVRDNGIGIAQEYHEKIFLPFTRAGSPKDYEGTGIGLAIVKNAVERLGGRVGLESTVGEGSRFWIDLPAEA